MRNVHVWRCQYANHTLANWSLPLFPVHIKMPFVKVWRHKIQLLAHFGMCRICPSIQEILGALMKQSFASIRNRAKVAWRILWRPSLVCSFLRLCMSSLGKLLKRWRISKETNCQGLNSIRHLSKNIYNERNPSHSNISRLNMYNHLENRLSNVLRVSALLGSHGRFALRGMGLSMRL